MALRFVSVAVFLCTSLPSHGLAQLGAPAGDCPAGMMQAPQPPETGMGSMAAMNPTSAIASAAKKKILGSKAKADSAAAAPAPAKPKCLTPEEFAVEAKAQQSAALKGAATAAFSATPIGMAVMGAKAAAPVAGKVAGAISSRFRKGPSKEAWTKALTTGRLEVENMSFDAGADGPTMPSLRSLQLLAEVLKSSDGKYVIRVTPESNGTTAADPKLAFLRGQLLMAALVAAGVPAERISVAPPATLTSWDNGPPKKREARVEVVPFTQPTTSTKQ